MKDTMTVFSFCEWFRQSENRKNQFSFEGLKALYDYLTNMEDDIGEEIEFDPIAICCEYTEYESLDELNDIYGKKFEDLEEVSDYTPVIPVRKLNTKTWKYEDGGFIVRDW